MQLSRLGIHNFRLLHDVALRIGHAPACTIMVGPNNSGKTSVAELLQLFATGDAKRITISDFSLDLRPEFETAQASLLAFPPDGDVATLVPPPTINLTLHFTYADVPEDLIAATKLLMDLDAAARVVALAIDFAPIDLEKLQEEFVAARKENEGLHAFLSRRLHDYYGFSYFKVAPATGERMRLDNHSVVASLIHVDLVEAQRHIADQDSQQATRLSRLLHEHYSKRHELDSPEDHEQLEQAIRTSSDELSGRYMKAFAGLTTALEQFGYPQKQSPKLSVKAELDARTLFKDTTRVYYAAQLPKPPDAEQAPTQDLPEKYNGLGFKNLIYMIMQVKAFRDAYEGWEGVRPRVHLILVEEPEVHLHPQMQMVFIKEITRFLNPQGGNTTSQLLLTTHSSYLVADSGFAPVRYFRRNGNRATVRDLLEYQDTLSGAEGAIALRFLQQYFTLTRCDLFFCDKVILVEGSVERLLLPAMVRQAAVGPHAALASEYLSLMEVGGAYAHLFKTLLAFLAVPALIITDIDSLGADGKRCAVANGQTTSNGTLKKWLPAKTSLADLHAATAEHRTDGRVRVAYQIPEAAGGKCGRSFEEAFIYANADWLIANRASLPASADSLNFPTADALRLDAYATSIDKIEKVDFALDLLGTGGWTSPKYIADGLGWLADQSL